jgi:hypothetical protein
MEVVDVALAEHDVDNDVERDIARVQVRERDALNDVLWEGVTVSDSVQLREKEIEAVHEDVGVCDRVMDADWLSDDDLDEVYDDVRLAEHE